jgi:hypothetical protein
MEPAAVEVPHNTIASSHRSGKQDDPAFSCDRAATSRKVSGGIANFYAPGEATMTGLTYEKTILQLFASLGLDTVPADVENDFNTIRIGSLDIDVVGTQPGFVNFLCFPGTIGAPTISALNVVLASNCFQQAHPPITLGTVPDEPGKIVLWSRVPLNEQSVPAMVALVRRMTDTGLAVQGWLAAGAPAVDGSKEFTKTLPGKSTAERIKSFGMARR